MEKQRLHIFATWKITRLENSGKGKHSKSGKIRVNILGKEKFSTQKKMKKIIQNKIDSRKILSHLDYSSSTTITLENNYSANPKFSGRI